MRSFERPISTLALIAALTAALTLGGCGRKSGLDLPPSASAAPASAGSASAASVAGAAPAAQAKPTATAPAFPIMRAHRPAPDVVPKRDLPIDVLLN
jgi:predicted small lipoprotein YifL